MTRAPVLALAWSLAAAAPAFAQAPVTIAAAPAAAVAPAPVTAAPAAPETPKTEGALQPTAATPAPAPVPAAPPKPEVTLVARIDLTNQRLSVAVNGKPTHTWNISSGRRGFETPTGSFRPSWMAKMWYSRTYDLAPMPHAVFFNGGIAVHATQATGMLGQPASHGCIRLAPANAAIFYGLVSRHGLASTRVVVTGWPKFGAPAMARGPGADRARTASGPSQGRPVVAAGYGSYAAPTANDGFNSPFAALFGSASAPQPAPVIYRTMPTPKRIRVR